MACQVSGAVVAAVSAMTVELGRRLAPVIVEKGGKVSFSKGFLQVVCSVLFLDSDPPYFQPVPSFGFIKRLWAPISRDECFCGRSSYSTWREWRRTLNQARHRLSSSDCDSFFRNCLLFVFQVLPDSMKKKDDVDGTSTMDEVVKVAVSGARGRISVNITRSCKLLLLHSVQFLAQTGVAIIYQGLENSWKVLYKSLQHATVQTVDHKWVLMRSTKASKQLDYQLNIYMSSMEIESE